MLLRARDVRASTSLYGTLGKLSTLGPLGPFLTVDAGGALRGAPGGSAVGGIDACPVTADTAWLPVFGVADAAECAARVVAAGGAVRGRTGGYFYVCADPLGVEFGVRAEHVGGLDAARSPAPGELAWLERCVGSAEDVAPTAAFFAEALGWDGGVVAAPPPDGVDVASDSEEEDAAAAAPYAVMWDGAGRSAGKHRVAGITTASEVNSLESPEPVRPQWLPYFDPGSEQALELVANRLRELPLLRPLCPPTETADGTFFVLMDTLNMLKVGLLHRTDPWDSRRE